LEPDPAPSLYRCGSATGALTQLDSSFSRFCCIVNFLGSGSGFRLRLLRVRTSEWSWKKLFA
jgi:hypothetical protein